MNLVEWLIQLHLHSTIHLSALIPYLETAYED